MDKYRFRERERERKTERQRCTERHKNALNDSMVYESSGIIVEKKLPKLASVVMYIYCIACYFNCPYTPPKDSKA